MKRAIAPSMISKAPTIKEAKVIFLTFQLFGFAVYDTLSVARDIVTKSLANINRVIPSRETTKS